MIPGDTTTLDLQRDLRNLQISSSFSARHSLSYLTAQRQIQAIQAELYRRAHNMQAPPGRTLIGPGYELDRRNWEGLQ